MAGNPANQFGKFADSLIRAATNIDEFVAGIVYHQENQRVGAKELVAGLASFPSRSDLLPLSPAP